MFIFQLKYQKEEWNLVQLKRKLNLKKSHNNPFSSTLVRVVLSARKCIFIKEKIVILHSKFH